MEFKVKHEIAYPNLNLWLTVKCTRIYIHEAKQFI